MNEVEHADLLRRALAERDRMRLTLVNRPLPLDAPAVCFGLAILLGETAAIAAQRGELDTLLDHLGATVRINAASRMGAQATVNDAGRA